MDFDTCLSLSHGNKLSQKPTYLYNIIIHHIIRL